MERPRNQEHGDYATNVALQLAKPAGTPPREVAEILAGRLRQVAGIAAVDVAGPGFLNITLRQPRRGRRHDRRCRPRVRPQRRGRQAAGQPRVRQRQPDRAGPRRRHAVGRRRRRARPAALGERRRGHARVLRQRRRRPDRPVRARRCWPPRRASRSRRTATPGRTSPRSPRRCWGPSRAARASRTTPCSRRSARDGVELMLAEHHAIARRVRRRTSTSGSPSGRCTTPASVERGPRRLRAQGHIYEADGAVWLRTTDFGDDKDRVLVKSDGDHLVLHVRRGLLPRQARARLRPLHLHARRRPPRLRRPAAGDGRLLRRRPGARRSRSSSASWSTSCAAASRCR